MHGKYVPLFLKGLEINRLLKLNLPGMRGMDHCFALKIIVVKNDRVVFKHELYRRTIEDRFRHLNASHLIKKYWNFFWFLLKKKERLSG
jgi:hypothetical protein